MDGYVADGAPIFSQGYKYSPVAHLTYGLVGDTDILKTAPQDLIQEVTVMLLVRLLQSQIGIYQLRPITIIVAILVLH